MKKKTPVPDENLRLLNLIFGRPLEEPFPVDDELDNSRKPKAQNK